MSFTNAGARRLKNSQAPDLAALSSVIQEHQAAIAGLEAGRIELESILEHLLSGTKGGAVPLEGADRATALSKRELQVLGLMVAGKTSKEIASGLGISFKLNSKLP
jgi:DNA-binding NarL/FixJ family response regulator